MQKVLWFIPSKKFVFTHKYNFIEEAKGKQGIPLQSCIFSPWFLAECLLRTIYLARSIFSLQHVVWDHPTIFPLDGKKNLFIFSPVTVSNSVNKVINSGKNVAETDFPVAVPIDFNIFCVSMAKKKTLIPVIREICTRNRFGFGVTKLSPSPKKEICFMMPSTQKSVGFLQWDV